MRKIRQSAKFGKEIRLLLRRGKNIAKLEKIITSLTDDVELSSKNKDHPLVGNWSGYRECHVDPDWLLIYKVDAEIVFLARTGTHSDLVG